ncbi:hypothetical protein J6590_042401 [Homalodisca vitripennis]|nr:hypothetical protein J6590_079758 [Homalodisca vitripennis]KAG8299617.1 hypothetical protein J6590_096473 [Homalodisca vitripennis]KAG8311526.1 hypothetical protein J6590_042397 [Homalodisca vitripennis]KAG8311529.1 hypothetical protein J6590_042401 [Homalodisca vitripennis]
MPEEFSFFRNNDNEEHLCEVEENGTDEASNPQFTHTVYIFGDSHARDQATHLNASLKGTLNVRSTCCPGWPLNEVVEKAIARLEEFAALTLHDFIVIVGGSNDTSEIHQRKLSELYALLFKSLPNTNIIVCETPFRFDEIEKNTEIAKTNIMVSQLCSAYPNATFLPMINAMQRYHFTNHGLHMKQSGKRILSVLISQCIKKILWQNYVTSLKS